MSGPSVVSACASETRGGGGVEPGAGAVKEPVAKRNKFDARSCRCRLLQLRIAARAGSDRRRCREGKPLVLIGEVDPWRIPEPRTLQQVAADPSLRQRCEQVSVALGTDLAVTQFQSDWAQPLGNIGNHACPRS